MKKRTAQWVQSARYRLKSAKLLLQGHQFVDAIFHCQQSIELMLKALLSEQEEADPPREHDLLKLSNRLKFPLPPLQKQITGELHDVSVPLRYPDDFVETVESYREEEAQRIYRETQELLQWLGQHLS